MRPFSMNKSRWCVNPFSHPSPARPASGVTLIELLVVMAVMSLLIAILLPSFRSAREDARRTTCLAHLKTVGLGLVMYANDNQDRGPVVMERLNRTAPRTLLSVSGMKVNMGLMWDAFIPDARIFLCPSQKEFSYVNRVEELPHLTIGGSYAYAVHLPAREAPKFGGLRHLAVVSDDFISYRYGDGVGKFSHRTGYNVLYIDGSASWYPDPDEKIWQRRIYWDDERDDITYQTLYDPNTTIPPGEYGDALDIFRVWHAFCYNTPVSFE